MSKGSEFGRKAIPWMYSGIGSRLAIAVMKLLPIHKRLSELEIRNLQDYFNSDFVSPECRRQLNRFQAFWLSYINAIHRIGQISRKARQDYYALIRRGCFAAERLPVLDKPVHPDSRHLPLLIVPGLNTPPVFFREMHEYFTGQGYNVSVLTLPDRGFADIATSAEALREEISRIHGVCNTQEVNVVGHCLGGIVGQYYLESTPEKPGVSRLISLGTGFLGAEGVHQLKRLWMDRNPEKPVPQVFDQLIQWNINVARRSTEVAYHSIITIWDFMVHFRKGLLDISNGGMVTNLVLDDPSIDHLTLALNRRVFEKIDTILSAPPQVLQKVS